MDSDRRTPEQERAEARRRDDAIQLAERVRAGALFYPLALLMLFLTTSLEQNDSRLAWGSFVFYLGLALHRYTLTLRPSAYYAKYPRGWALQLRGNLLVCGATWAALVLYVNWWSELDAVYATMMLMTAGIVAGGVLTVSSERHFPTLFSGIVLIPFVVHGLVVHQQFNLVITMYSAWYILFLSGVARQMRASRLAAYDAQDALLEQNRVLERARLEAEAATLAKGQFLATMSHEIRTPMNGVLGMASFLRETSLDAEQTECVDTIERSGEVLLSVINDILDYSKLEAGKVVLEPLCFEIGEFLRTTRSLVLPNAQAKNLGVELEAGEDLPDEMTADPTRLRQILLNLLGNAIKFTEEGRIVLRARRHLDTRIRFEVEDSGIGIEADAIPELFRPFEQADSSTTRRYGGTGLGLAICRQLAEAMDGSVGVVSKLGEGSRFWVELPLTEVAADAESAGITPEPDPEPYATGRS